MDKLKPIITHRFWIISAPAILLPVIAWWMATGQLAADIDKRLGELKTAFDGIPNPSNSPNQTWADGLTVINKAVEERNKESAQYLWQMQRELMFWPNNIADMMAQVEYRGDDVPNAARDLYRNSYRPTLEAVHKLVQPYDIETGKGQILADIEIMPQVDREKWEILSPTAQEMWDAQEDIWLLKSLLESIQRVNEGSTLVTESPIRSIDVLELRGGSKSTGGGGGGAPGGGLGGGTGGVGGAGMPGGAMADAMAGKGPLNMGVGMQDQGPKTASFPPEDEFGSDVDSSAANNNSGGIAAAAAPAAGGAPLAGSPAGMGMGGQDAPKLRYYDNDESMPFKTRGFYLEVVMEIRRVPELMVELTNSPWPVRIVRVQQSDLILDEFEIDGGGRLGGSGRGGVGMPMAAAASGSGGGRRSSSRTSLMTPGRTSGPGGLPMAADAGRSGPLTGPNSATSSMEYQNIATAALSDPDLCTVAIAGLMTIYRPIENSDDAAAGSNGSTPPIDPLAGAADVSGPGSESALDPSADGSLTVGDDAEMTEEAGEETDVTEDSEAESSPTSDDDTSADPDSESESDTDTPTDESGDDTSSEEEGTESPEPSDENETSETEPADEADAGN